MTKKAPEGKDGMKRLNIKIDPSDENGIYANFFTLLQSQNEFILDFGLLMPATGSVRIGSRVLLHPRIAKQLAMVLTDSIRKYETTFGKIAPMKQAEPRILN